MPETSESSVEEKRGYKIPLILQKPVKYVRLCYVLIGDDTDDNTCLN